MSPMTVSWGHRLARRFGLVLMVSGALAIVWGFLVWRWEDPFTALYTSVTSP